MALEKCPDCGGTWAARGMAQHRRAKHPGPPPPKRYDVIIKSGVWSKMELDATRRIILGLMALDDFRFASDYDPKSGGLPGYKITHEERTLEGLSAEETVRWVKAYTDIGSMALEIHEVDP